MGGVSMSSGTTSYSHAMHNESLSVMGVSSNLCIEMLKAIALSRLFSNKDFFHSFQSLVTKYFFQIPLPIVSEVDTYVNLFSTGPNNDYVDSCDGVCMLVSIHLCIETWSPASALAFSYVVLVMMYLLPLIGISILYFLIGRTMWRRRPVGNSSAREVKLYQQKRHIITFMIVLVVTFAVLWGPYFIIHCLRRPISNRYVGAYLQMMGHANVAVNPILYAYFHRNIRKQAVVYVRRASMLLGLTGEENFENSSPVSTIRPQTASEKRSRSNANMRWNGKENTGQPSSANQPQMSSSHLDATTML